MLAIPPPFLGLVVGLPPEGGWIHSWLQPVFFHLEPERFAWVGTGGERWRCRWHRARGVDWPTWPICGGRALPASVAAPLPVAYKASLHKLYMDEFYAARLIGVR